MTNGWAARHYRLARAVLGLYLFVHFSQLAPWAAELFSNRGALSDATGSPLVLLFPNVLAFWDGPVFVTTLVIAAAAASVLLAVGRYDRMAAVAIWYAWACLHGRMPLIVNPGLPYIGWLLLMHASLPPLLRASSDDAAGSDTWRMPDEIFLVAWILMALGYTYSGLTKLASPSWVNGSALAYVLENPLARAGVVRNALLSLPEEILRFSTWTVLALELAFAPLACIRRLRPWLWLSMCALHIGLIIMLDFADLSLGMLMMHVFTWDPAWMSTVRGRLSFQSRGRALTSQAYL
jgi:hypothetical protein